MTNELEKQFFDTFNLIKYKLISKCNKLITYGPFDTLEDINTVAKGSMDVFIIEEFYPQITDRILLELICILTEWRQYCASDYIIKAINIDILKNDILKDCLYMSNWYEFKKCGKDIKHQIRTLFEEG